MKAFREWFMWAQLIVASLFALGLAVAGGWFVATVMVVGGVLIWTALSFLQRRESSLERAVRKAARERR